MTATLQTPRPNPDAAAGSALSRETVLAAVLDPGQLPTPPAVALQIVNAASRPDCNPAEIVALLSQDPALCKLLKAVNSCLYGLSKPVASPSRAVAVLGLNGVRSLALGLSLPALRAGGVVDAAMREYWLAAVGSGIMARELATRTRRPAPEDDLIAGLLHDLGSILLRRTFPDAWRDLTARGGERLVSDPCGAEREAFGVSHADVAAELLHSWNLPKEIVEPIRFHHEPERLAGTPAGPRAELLHLVGHLARVDSLVHSPSVLDHVLDVARERFGLDRSRLVEFLEGVAPKVEEFARLLNQDVGKRPDYAAVLSAGTQELVKLTVATSREQPGGNPPPAAATVRGRPGDTPPVPRPIPRPAPPTPAPSTTLWGGGREVPQFCTAFVENLPPTGCRLGEYELRQQVGRGAMGVVYRAYEPALDRFVAVKVLTPALAACEMSRRRFAREARVAAAIQHDNVVAIHAVRETGGVSYLAMEYVRGGCLEDRVEQHGPLPLPLLTSAGRQTAAGLAAAHARQIVHRDIKPANIMLEAETGRVKITDFGLARVVDDRNLSMDGGIVGTPFFMAPEVVQGEAATTASDLFSLGGVFYALSTGWPPFIGQNIAAVLHAVCEKEPVRPRRLRPDLPPWMEDIILRLLQKDPARRFASADEVAALFAERTAE